MRAKPSKRRPCAFPTAAPGFAVLDVDAEPEGLWGWLMCLGGIALLGVALFPLVALIKLRRAGRTL